MPIKKIAIVGPESTGKSVLSEKLAIHFKTQWVPEFAREYLDKIARPYQKEDLIHIAKGQIDLEDRLANQANGLLICDTNLIVVKIWSEVKYGECNEWILKTIKERNYDHHLLMNIDLPWEFDPYREHPHMRGYLFKKYEDELTKSGIKYTIIEGNYQERFEKAVQIISNLLYQQF